MVLLPEGKRCDDGRGDIGLNISIGGKRWDEIENVDVVVNLVHVCGPGAMLLVELSEWVWLSEHIYAPPPIRAFIDTSVV